MAFKKPLIFCASMLHRLASELTWGKQRLLQLPYTEEGTISVEGSLVQHVINFTYLKVVISSDGCKDCKTFSAYSIWNASGAFKQLSSIWNKCSIQTVARFLNIMSRGQIQIWRRPKHELLCKCTMSMRPPLLMSNTIYTVLCTVLTVCFLSYIINSLGNATHERNPGEI